jgi:phosphotransferase system HPr-like phosphotransfer protein
MLRDLRVRAIAHPEERKAFLKRACTEELARVYEATVHNLQSTYDTHLQNTVLESADARLPRLRGHVSGALHLLATVTYLTHFFERHEDEVRSEEVKHHIGRLISRTDVQATILDLLVLATGILEEGRSVAEALLPEYTNVQEMSIEVGDGLVMHARPAALIVGIVNHYGTPVEMEIAGQVCNAASILELLVCVGSHPEERRFVFRGDENPLRDIRLLFESELGENGLEQLPEALAYLRGGA